MWLCFTQFLLIQHEFVKNAKPVSVLQKMILEAKEIQEEQTLNTFNGDEPVSKY